MDLEIKILDEREIVHFPRPGHPQVMHAVTYQVGQGVPRVVYIPQAEMSDQRLRDEIRADLEKAPAEGARTIRL